MKRFGVISCTDDKKWGFSEAMVSRYTEFFRLKGEEEWFGFHAMRGDIPAIEDLEKFDAFLITGSISSVNDDKEWIKNLMSFIKSAADLSKEKKTSKIVGICFGHQLIAKALGGTVGRNPDQNFVLQTEVIKSTPDLSKCEGIKDIFNKENLRVLQSHGECVLELPENALSVGTSASCSHEIVQFTDNIIGFQFHTEIHNQEAEELILPYIAKSFHWAVEDVKKSTESLKLECDYKAINQFITKYINTTA